MTAEELWRKSGLTGSYESWAFSDAPDKLADLVKRGVKTATCSPYDLYQTGEEQIPKEGDYSVILDSNGEAVCIVKTVKVCVTEFHQVSEEHAYKEGEGDRSLEYWRKVHMDFLKEELAKMHLVFSENTKVVCEEFELVKTMIDLSVYEKKKIGVYLKDALPSIRSTEEEMDMLFSVGRPFSEHLKRWEDNELPDKYDNNFFEYFAQPTQEEYDQALRFQRERGDRFIKLEGDFPLTDDFGLSAGVTLTMQLSGDTDDWIVNDEIEIKEPGYKEFKEMELKHFGLVYGEDFTVRNADRLFETLDFRGAYIGEKLVGAYYFYSSNGYTCVDGLIVDEDHRHRYIATTLLKHAVSEAAGNVVFLHADRDDAPRKIYEKLGFREVHRRYEYLSTDISGKQTAEDESEAYDDFDDDIHSPCLRFQK